MARDNWDAFTTAYVECALWSSTTDSCEDCGEDRNRPEETCECGGNWETLPLDEGFDISDLSDDAVSAIENDCQTFQEENAVLLSRWYSEARMTPDRAGHDFWLTRNHHGAGFWDRWSGDTPQAAIGRLLTDAAHAYGSADLYVGDDGRIYLS